jgi:S1-C subfamily serine protease
MSHDDDADDEAGALRPPLPPEDRLWRHPSELSLHGPAGAPVRPVLVHPVGRAGAWGTVVVAGLVGAVLMAGILSVSGQFGRDVVERPVVEKVALSTLVPTRMVQGDPGVAAVVRRLEPAIVRLQLSGPERSTTGSGVVFRDDGMVLTSAHLVRDATTVGVRLADGRRFTGRVVGIDPLTDVAVVDVDATGLEVAVLGSAKDVEIGTTTLAIGSATGDQGRTSVSTGVISAVGRSVGMVGGDSLHGLLQTDAPIAPTASGGALVDATGSVIGIVTSVTAVADGATDEAERFGFATPIDRAHRVAMQLIATGHATHGWLGVEGEDLSPDEAASLGVAGGARLRGVRQGGPADKAGLDDDDVITDVDGHEVDSMPGLAVEVRDHEPGDEVEVGYWRDGKHETAEVEVGERP